MSKYTSFRFKHYEFHHEDRRLNLYYGYDDALEFCETYHFDFDFAEYSTEALKQACELLFFMTGISYYKMYLAPTISVEAGLIDSTLADFLSKTYQKGLGEFFYMNQLNPLTEIEFPVNSHNLPTQRTTDHDGILIGLGGGKDSLVSVELLRDQPGVTTWTLNHHSQLEPLVEKIGLPHLRVNRIWDEKIGELNNQDAMNGHVPISAIFACTGTIVAILSGNRDVVVSNESSASEATMNYQGTDINHQYSKSLEFEKDFQNCLLALFDNSVRYYSLLRPFTELRIAEIFAKIGFIKYKDVFSSCNRAFTHDQNHMFWCGECAKCAFVFLILTPFIDRSQLENMWNGKNLLLNPANIGVYKQLLGIEGDKPFDCVGEIKEARAAMRMAQNLYPELLQFKFDLPEDYDFKAWNEASMPDEISSVLKSKLAQL